eukprot:gene38635-47713_t
MLIWRGFVVRRACRRSRRAPNVRGIMAEPLQARWRGRPSDGRGSEP